MRYKIVRHYAPSLTRNNEWGEPYVKPKKVVKRGLTLEQAQKHCNDPKTHKPGQYFDGYEPDSGR